MKMASDALTLNQPASDRFEPDRLRRVFLAGAGSYLPARQVSNAELATQVNTSDEWIVSRTGIRARHFAAPGEATSDLALVAARRALASAGCDAHEIDLITLGTATPDTLVPSTACWLQGALGAKHAAAMDISAGCCGFVYALHMASSLLRCESAKSALVVGAEVLSRFLNFADRQSCVLFGDGAGAVVLGQSGHTELIYSHIGSNGQDAALIQIPAGGSRAPTSSATLDASGHSIVLNGQEVFKVAVRVMVEQARKALNALQLTPCSIDWLVPHHANARIIDAVAQNLGVPSDRVVSQIESTGNTSSASIPSALAHLLSSGRVRLGHRIMLLAFGSGLTWGCQVFEASRDISDEGQNRE